MKKLSIVFFLIPIICFGQIKPDKYYHAGVGTGIAISSHLIFKGENVNPYKGTLLTAPIATGKELYDSYNGGKFSFSDIGATLLIPVLIDTGVLIVKRVKKRRKIIDPFEYNPELVRSEGVTKTP
jgi:hypothetical protein